MLSLLTQTILADTMRVATRTDARHHPRPAEPYVPRSRRRAPVRIESERLPD